MIPLFKVWMSPFASGRVATVLNSGYIGQGPVVEAFEAALAQRIGTPNVLSTNSGTSAIDLALACIGVGPGDEVISTPMTCSATNMPIHNRGATIVWADIDSRSGLISPESIEAAITPRTKAIVVVDWAGERSDVEAIRRFSQLPILIDAAHRAPVHDDRYAPGAQVLVAYSFQAIKFLTTGDGGALLVPEAHYRDAKLRRWFGLDRESSADFRCAQRITLDGYKYHMTDIDAAIGLANLEGLDARIARQRMVAFLYRGQGIRLSGYPDSHFWVAFLHVNDREGFQRFMADRDIATSLVHSRNDLHPVFANGRNPSPLSGLDSFDKTYIAIPCGWWLTDAEVEHISSSVLAWEKSHGRPE